MTKRAKFPTVKQIEKSIGISASKWSGRCYEISSAIVRSGLVKGTAVYGHYLGPIAEDSIFANLRGIGWARHGWILRRDGSIVDPTRWVFESKYPHLFVGGPGHPDYDEGGNGLREYGQEVPPIPHPNDPTTELAFSSDGCALVCRLLGRGLNGGHLSLTFPEMMWLANLPYGKLQPCAFDVYQGFEAAGEGALVPIDNRLRAKREHDET